MTRRLLLFANSFPYGKQEPYLMREAHYYDAFDEVYIFALSIRPHQKDSIRNLPLGRIRVIPIHFKPHAYYALNALTIITTPALWKELKELRRTNRLSGPRLVQALSQFSRAAHESRVIRRFVKQNISSDHSDTNVLYAYRFLYQPYLMSRVADLFPSARLIGRAHGIDLFEERSSTCYLPGRTINLEMLDELHMVSEHGAQYLRSKHPGFADKIHVSYLGTEDQGVRPPRDPHGPLRIVSCSGVVGVKRLTLLAEALRLLPGGVRVQWDHYGDGDGLPELEQNVANLPDHVSVRLHGWTANDEVLQAYREGRHDVFVNVSSSEGLPVSIMESSSCGLPTIATAVGGTGEIVQDGHNGILLSANPSPSEVTAAIHRMATMGLDEYAHWSANARAQWEASFDSNVNYRRFIDGLLA